jgi:hypothetical protein
MQVMFIRVNTLDKKCFYPKNIIQNHVIKGQIASSENVVSHVERLECLLTGLCCVRFSSNTVNINSPVIFVM